MAESPVPPEPLYADQQGSLPWPWVAFPTVDPADKTTELLYYHNLQNSETCWGRPQVRVAEQNVIPHRPKGGPSCLSWRDWHSQELSSISSAAAAETFRTFCVRLYPRGHFLRRGGGMLWRFRDTEPVGLVLYPEPRRLAVAFDPAFLPPEAMAALQKGFSPGASVHAPNDDAPLGVTAKFAVMEQLQRSMLSQQSAADALAVPEAFLLRRYIATMGGVAGKAALHADVRALAAYLKEFEPMPPFSCRLTGVPNMKDEFAFAEHLLSDTHRQWRGHLRAAVELQAMLKQVPVSERQPSLEAKYALVKQWIQRRFQDIPMADGRVLCFDHLRGTGEPLQQDISRARPGPIPAQPSPQLQLSSRNS